MKINLINIILKIISTFLLLTSNYFFILTMAHPNIFNINLFIIFFFLYNFTNPILNYLFKLNEIKTCKKLELNILYSIKTKDILYLESEDFNKNINLLNDLRNKFNDKQNDICDFIDGTITTFGICFFLSFYISIPYIIIYFLIKILFIFYQHKVSLKSSSTTYEFWKKYRENTRLYNNYSDVLTQKKYIIEKNIFNFKNFFINKFNKEFDNAKKRNEKLGKRRLFIESKQQLFYFFLYFFELLFLIYFIYLKIMPVSFFVAIFPQIILNSTKLSNLFFSINDYKEVIKYEQDLSNLINSNQAYYLSKSECSDFALQIKNVSFSYFSSTKNVVDKISFDFEKGKKYAIVGENGCGKTTLVKLICGLYKPNFGQVVKGGRVCVLFQNFNKYAANIKDNICLGKDVDDLKIDEVLESVCLKDEFYQYENKLQKELTNLKKDGIDLSLGQWQRLALARVLLHDADIVILDEPTSSLDPLIEKNLYDRYLKIFDGKTLLMITHRLGFIQDFDEVLVIKDGKILEHGKPSVLLENQNSTYKKIIEEQKELYEA